VLQYSVCTLCTPSLTKVTDAIHMELMALAAEVSSIRANTVAAGSKAAYRRSAVKFLAWLYIQRQDLLTNECMAYLNAATDRTVALFELLSRAPQTPPIAFDTIQASDFLMWIVTLRKSDGSTPGYSTYNTHRAAFFNLFRDYKRTMSKDLESELSNHFKGLKRQSARQIANGLAEVKVGKDPLSFSLYRYLGLQIMGQTSREYVFARCFMVLCWNLMSRASNAFGIRHSHMEWHEDALSIYFSHMKNDQAADRPRDPRHVYANPLMPEICPILSLGMYWMCYSFDVSSNQLFPGANQNDRFRKLLSKCLNTETIARELERRAVDPSDIGTHSMRKGSATYSSSGSTACPSTTAIHLRAGWALGGVQDTYMRYESAGDMFVGRTVSGLPTDRPEFGILPPRFHGPRDSIEAAIDLCFPGIPPCLRLIGEYSLASVIFHREFIRSTLPNRHPLHPKTRFADERMHGLFELSNRLHGGTV
jgi:hypothetical protein